MKAELLRKLHEGPDVLVLPNAWDAISARVMESEGFPAVATTSAGCAAVLGYADGQQIPRAEMIFLVAKIAAAVDVPVTADVEAGYGDAVQTAHDLLAAGAVGLNLEDMDENALLPVATQVDRIRAIREAFGLSIVINARTDIFLAQLGDPATRFERTVERLNQYRDAGADCLFVPGVKDAETIGRLAQAIRGPLNILATPGAPSIAEMKRLGVARVSLGSGPSRVALGAIRRLARDLKQYGTFEALGTESIPYDEVQKLLTRG
jgi:2-methylisocitrate lyase-like PEP mutase family enzyme